MTIDIVTLAGLGGVPVVIGLVHILKGYVKDKRAWPAMALALGVLWSVGIRLALGGPVEQSAIEGVVVGLAASGLFSQGKAITGA